MTASNAELALAWQVTATGLPESVAEHRFAPPRMWRFDRSWPAHKVAVEIEGGTWTNGRHSRGEGFEADCEKYNEAALGGWIVLRVTPRMVDDGRALRLIERAIALQET
jgi:hypothetical protein